VATQERLERMARQFLSAREYRARQQRKAEQADKRWVCGAAVAL
jgi:hypothetical protein